MNNNIASDTERVYHFCTYFDSNYLTRGIALYHSLSQHCTSFWLWVLCMDSACYDVLARFDLPGVKLISLEDFERGDDSLARARQNRSKIEYYFTCTPSLPLYIFKHSVEPDSITYLDADLFFFSDPKPVFDEIGSHSIAIIPHRFPPHLKDQERFGIFNVGWLTFRRDENGLACLNWWRDRCIEWCYTRAEDGRSADQKYLDDWTTRFDGVTVIQHQGANLAPWNLANYQIGFGDGRVTVDDQMLVFFHFHGLKRANTWSFDPCLEPYGARLSTSIRQGIFVPYIQTLAQVAKELAPHIGQTPLLAALPSCFAVDDDSVWWRKIARQVRNNALVLGDMLTRKFVFVVNDRVF